MATTKVLPKCLNRRNKDYYEKKNCFFNITIKNANTLVKKKISFFTILFEKKMNIYKFACIVMQLIILCICV